MNALMITQYDKFGMVGRAEYIENFIHEMDIDISILPLYNEWLLNNSDDPIYSINEFTDIIKDYEPQRAFEIAIASFNQFSFNDDYFSYDGYMNLVSYSEYEIIEQIRDNDSFLEWYIEEYDLIDWNQAEKDIADANELIRQGY